MENLLFLGVPILKHIRVNDVTDLHPNAFAIPASSNKPAPALHLFCCIFAFKSANNA